MDLLWTAGRVLVSLVVVLALVWVLAQAARRRGAGGAVATERFSVVARQALGRTAGVAVVRVGDQALVLGVTEQSVRLLAQAPLTDLTGPAPQPALQLREPVLTGPGGPPSTELRLVEPAARHLVPVGAPSGSGGAPSGSGGALAGSALSPATWSRALEVLRERTARR